MSTEQKHRLLRIIAMEPRTLRDLTEGDLHSTVSNRHVERWLAELEADRFIFDGRGRYFISDAGRAHLDEPTTMAMPRIHCSAAETEPYKANWTPVRPGADNHRKYLSRGLG